MAGFSKREREGRVFWEARINRKGITKSKVFERKRDAEAWAKEIEDALQRGMAGVVEIDKITVADVVDEYVKHGGRSKGDHGRARRIAEVMGGVRIEAMRHGQIEKFLAEMVGMAIPKPEGAVKRHPLFEGGRQRVYAPSTVRKMYFTLRHMLMWHARRVGYELNPHLFVDQEVPEAWGNVRERRLVGDEEERLLGAARFASIKNKAGDVVGKRPRAHGDAYAALIGLALATGARSQEMLLAEWREFNLDGREWKIPVDHIKTAKQTGKGRTVLLSDKAVAVMRGLEKRKSKTNPKVFHEIPCGNAPKQTWIRIVRDAGIKDRLGLHDLRHEAISRIVANSKLSQAEIMSMVGHTEFKTFERYIGLRGAESAHKLNW